MKVKKLIEKLSLSPLYNDEDEIRIAVPQPDGTMIYVEIECIVKQPYVLKDGNVTYYKDHRGTALIYMKSKLDGGNR